MSKLGRNNACPCGSGKQATKCCLSQNSATVINLTWQKIRQTEGFLIPLLLKYAANRLGSYVISVGWRTFSDEDLENETGEFPLEFKTIFLPWFLFNWIPELYCEMPDEALERAIALSYLAENGKKLDSFQRRFIETVCNEHFSFFMITAISPGNSLTLKDFFVEREVTVSEHLASLTLKIGDILFTRIMTMDGVSLMIGTSPFVIPQVFENYLLNMRKEWQDEIDDLGDSFLGDYALEMLNVYDEIKDRLQRSQTQPDFENTDGEPLLFVKLYYKLMIAPQLAFDVLKELAVSTSAEKLMQNAFFNAKSTLEAITIPWAEQNAETITVKGQVYIYGNLLLAEVNSQARADIIHAKISALLGDKAIYEHSLIETLETLLEKRQQSH